MHSDEVWLRTWAVTSTSSKAKAGNGSTLNPYLSRPPLCSSNALFGHTNEMHRSGAFLNVLPLIVQR